jgi:hypothetical protein
MKSKLKKHPKWVNRALQGVACTGITLCPKALWSQKSATSSTPISRNTCNFSARFNTPAL